MCIRDSYKAEEAKLKSDTESAARVDQMQARMQANMNGMTPARP